MPAPAFLAILLSVLPAACGVRLFERWSGRPVVERVAAAPPDRLWPHLSRRAGALDLVVSEVRPGEHLIQFDWIAAPGDGRLYLRCATPGTVGSAFFRPRVLIRPSPQGSTIVVASEVRTTTGADCRSTGHFESWLLGRLEPAIAASVGEAPAIGAETR